MTEILQKRCSKCGETKPIEMFSKCRPNPDGYQRCCKACVSIYHAGYRATHAESIRKQKKDWYDANTERSKAKSSAWQKANPDRTRARLKAWKEANPERDRELKRAWYDANTDLAKARERSRYDANGDAIRAQMRAYNRANPDVRRASRQRRRARLKGNGGSFTSAELKALRAAQAGICAYCKRLYDPDTLSIDHVIPVSRGGRNDRFNICLACPSCNSSKNDKTPDEWTNRWYDRDE